MNQQIWRMRPDGSEAERLTPGGKETNQLMGWDHSGRALIVASNQRDPSSTDIYLLAPGATALGTPAYVGKGMNGADDVARDGRRLLVNRLVSRGSNDLLLYELGSRSIVRRGSGALVRWCSPSTAAPRGRRCRPSAPTTRCCCRRASRCSHRTSAAPAASENASSASTTGRKLPNRIRAAVEMTSFIRRYLVDQPTASAGPGAR